MKVVNELSLFDVEKRGTGQAEAGQMRPDLPLTKWPDVRFEARNFRTDIFQC